MYFRSSRDAIKYAETFYADWTIRFDQQMQMFYIIGKLRKEQ